ncbi:hypothetical protein, partial [Enterocloster sp.]|uniref:hypothetical protein n=1 Tax=Enterocloster sp. TaxID=2719315 RepID=UPI003AF17701
EMKTTEEIRKEVNEAMIKEFNALHGKIIADLESGKMTNEEAFKMIRLQIDLAAQIVREQRALNGERAYLI